LNLSDHYLFSLVLDERVNILRSCAVEEKNSRPIDDEYAVAVFLEAKVKTKPSVIASFHLKMMQ
jgi:hypothetical protein